MKTIYSVILYSLLLIFVTGCTFEVLEESEISAGSVELIAVMEVEPESKTVLSGMVDGRYYPLWSAGDEIAVFADNDNSPSKFTLTSGEGGTSATFSGTRSGTEYLAMYPYDETASVNSKVLSLNLPQTQNYAVGSFGQGAYPMLAQGGSGGVLNFKNLCSVLKISLSGTAAVKSVTLTANDTETYLSGPATVALDNLTAGVPQLVMSKEGSNSVTLDCEGLEVSEDAPADVFISIPPQTYKGGLTIKVDTYTDTVTRAVESDIVFERSQIRAIPNFVFDTDMDAPALQLAKEREALIAIYNALDGDNWINNENWCSDKPVGEWYGVKTYNEHGFVSHLFFDGPNNYNGTLPDDVGVFEHLEYIRITDEGVNGELPENIFRSSKLREVSINSSNCSVSIPSTISELPCLAVLGLVCDAVSFPEHFGHLPCLETLHIRAKIGEIPDEIGTCASLRTLNVIYSDIISVPESISCLTQLKQLDLSHNKLTGEFPESLLELTDLKWFSIADNNLYGNIPVEIAGMLNCLEVSDNCPVKRFDLSDNDFVGGIPREIYEHPNWTYIWYQFYYGNSLDFKDVKIPCPDIVGNDIYGNPVNVELLNESKPYTILYQYPTYLGLSDLLFPNIHSVKEVYETYSGNMNLIFWGEEYATKEDIETLIEELGVDGWILCQSRMEDSVDDKSISINKSSCYPTNTYPYLFVVDKDGYIISSSDDWNHDYDKMHEFFDTIFKDDENHQDGVVTTLQKATEGNGIDIVLLGDAYSDRQIADGTYDADMKYLYDNLFTKEPFRTHKELFDVHYVNVVSATEGYEDGNTALEGYFGEGTLVGGNDSKCFDYALNAITEEEMDEALIIVAMNSDAYAGTCWMYYTGKEDTDYGTGPSIAYFPKGGDKEVFAQLLHHEANGHGFAKLADEYAYRDMGAVPSDYVTETKAQQADWGWWKNVDFTSDESHVRWSRFIEDERYADEGLGAFEGGLTYWTGVWRPTENSIMRYNVGDFNAPSREAIYYRIHKLAYGDSWQYDYEKFVEYDAVNRTQAAVAARAQRHNYVERTFEPTAPPVVVGKSWRNAM